MHHGDGHSTRAFPTTHWSLVARAGTDPGEAQREALGELVRRYLPALRVHLIVRKRLRPQDADDLLQAFLAAKVVEQNLVGRADRQKGKFRTYLLTALDRFVVNQLQHASAAKRSAAATPLHEDIPAADGDPAAAFDAAWAREVIAQALRLTRQRCHEQGREDLWQVLEGRVIRPLLDGSPSIPPDHLVPRLGLHSADEAWNLLATAKRTFARALRAVVAEYEADDRQIEAEIAELRAALAREA